MEPVSATGLGAFVGACWGANFAAGIVGNLVAAAGYDLCVKSLVPSALRGLRDLLSSGASGQNNDLWRALWVAQENAMVLCCEELLRVDKHLRPGGLAIPESLTDCDAWAGTFAGTDPEVRLLLRLRRQSIQRARLFEKSPFEDLQRQTLIAIDDAAALFAPGSESVASSASDLRTRTTALVLERLRMELAVDGGLPRSLETKVGARWFDYLRSSFREVLARHPLARTAFESQIWGRLDGLPVQLDEALHRLDHLDRAQEQVFQQLRWLVEAVQVVSQGLNAQHAQTIDEIQARLDAIDRDPRVMEADARLERSLRLLVRKLDYAIAGLPILPFRLPDPPTRELELLHAKHRAVDLVGRQTDLDALVHWLQSSDPISARLLVGGAGTGKTRLAFELLLRVNAEFPSWQAGLLTSDALRKFDATKQPADWTWATPTLFVVDYAQPLVGPLRELLLALTRKRDAGCPLLRLLLLERQPGDWFDDLLRQEDSGPCPVRSLFHPPTPVLLTPLPDGRLRRQILSQTLAKAARFTGKPVPTLPREGHLEFDASLKREIFDQPLNLMLAALAATEFGLLPALARSRIELAEAMASKELARVERFARDLKNDAQKRALRHLAACATMERGFTARELERAVAEELAALKLTWPDGPGDLATVLQEALGGRDLLVSPVEPDFVGEALVLNALARPDSLSGPDRWRAWCATVDRCCRRNPRATPATLLHAFQNFGHQADYGEPLLAGTDTLIRVGLADAEPELLLGIESAMPRQTVELRPRAAEVTRQLYLRLKGLLDHGREELKPEVGRLANNLAVRLSELGRQAEALVLAQEATDFYRALVLRSPDAFLPKLAVSLNNLANRLSEVGRRAEALVPAQEAVELHRAIVLRNPDAFQQDLAGSLNNLASRLGEVGRRAEALVQAQEAVELHRAIVLRNPDAFQPDLAMSLNNLATVLSELGRWVEALVPAQEAADLYRALVLRNPDAFLPDLAGSLNNLATFLSELGRQAEALVPGQEATNLYRALVLRNPDAFQPDLAMSLNNLAIRLSELDRRAEALVPGQEATDLYRALVLRNPGAFQPYLAMALNNLANHLSGLGRRAEALVPAQEATDLYRALVVRNPDAFQPDLASSLNNLANRLSEMGWQAEALVPAQEAVELRRAFVVRNPDAFQPDLAMSLHNLANHLSGLDRRAEAQVPAQEATDSYRALALRNPGAFQPYLAKSLGMLGRTLEGNERREEALASFAEGVRTLTRQFQALPEAHISVMTQLVQDYLRLALALNRSPDETLLAPVAEVFVRLKKESPPPAPPP